MDIVWLNTSDATNPNEVGSKAAALARLRELGFSTPLGFVVTVSAFQNVLKEDGLASMVSSLSACSNTEQLTRRLAEVQFRIDNFRWNPILKDAITKAYRSLGGSVAVRSSGIAEDGERSAFAGAYTSFLERMTEEEVLEAVRNCWNSAFSQSVVAYRTQHEMTDSGWLMGVIVQTMVFADKSGVMFTRDPFGEDNSILIEAVPGGCKQIVSGSPAQMSAWIDRENRKIVRLEHGPSTLQRFGTGATGVLGERMVQSARLLRAKEIDLLVDTGLRLEAVFGLPQDVEWAIADGELVLLQTRPLTTYNLAGANT